MIQYGRFFLSHDTYVDIIYYPFLVFKCICFKVLAMLKKPNVNLFLCFNMFMRLFSLKKLIFFCLFQYSYWNQM